MNHDPTIRNRYGRKFLPGRATRRSPLLFTSLLTAFVFVFLISVGAENRPALTSAESQAAAVDWKAVEVALGKAGTMQPGDVYKVSLPRTDLKIMVGSIQLKPAFALGSWIAFKKMGNTTMVMGDLVLTEDEVTRVMTKLQEGGVEQTALHNHVLHESPRVMYMHISAMGDAVKIATAIHDALALGRTPFTAPVSTQNPELGIDTKQLDKIMAQSGKVNSGVYQFSIQRAEKIFENGIEVTALHSHMLDENPRLFFMHFWADDDRQKLARGLRAALDKMNIVRAQTE